MTVGATIHDLPLVQWACLVPDHYVQPRE